MLPAGHTGRRGPNPCTAFRPPPFRAALPRPSRPGHLCPASSAPERKGTARASEVSGFFTQCRLRAGTRARAQRRVRVGPAGSRRRKVSPVSADLLQLLLCEYGRRALGFGGHRRPSLCHRRPTPTLLCVPRLCRLWHRAAGATPCLRVNKLEINGRSAEPPLPAALDRLGPPCWTVTHQ
jgi:hypothetical protein